MSKHTTQQQRLPTPPQVASSPPLSLTSSPLFDQALAALPLSSPSTEARHGRSSTDIVGREVDEDVDGYFDIATQEEDGSLDTGGADMSWKGFTGVPTGIPLASPEQIPQEDMDIDHLQLLGYPTTTALPTIQTGDLESQETTSTDKLDKEFQDGEDLILAQAELELAASPRQSGVHSGTENEATEEKTPVFKKRKRSTTPTPFPQTLASTSRQPSPPVTEAGPAPSAAGQDDAWRYTEDDAYAASKFGGIGEYMRHKRMKLQIQNRAIAESRGGAAQYPQIFQGLEIYINGYVRPSLETLRELIMMHGGTYIPYLDRKGMITHIIASNLTPAKFREFSKYKVVLPSWLTDSVDKGQLLDWRTYKLVPKGGGEEEGMRGGMSQFLAGGAAAGGGKSGGSVAAPVKGGTGNKGKGKAKAHVVHLSDEEMSADQGVPVAPVPRRLRFDTVPQVMESPADRATETASIMLDMDADHATRSPETPAQPPLSASKATPRITPTKSLPHLAPVFAGKSPNSIKQIAAPPKGQSVGLTSDPLTFAHAAAMGYAKNAENLDAKRLMKSAEWREQHTAANEGFLEGYYQNSRLHHLSSWKAELKLLVAQAQSAAESSETIHTLAPGAIAVPTNELSFTDSTLPKAQTKPATTTIGLGRGNNNADGGSEKIIFHVDFDAFFVSCGLATRPELRGEPVVVCHSQGTQGSAKDDRNQNTTDSGKGSTSEIASCSYEARAKGVKNGMSLGQARRLCPDVQTMPYEFETYKRYSLAFYTILMAYADELQAVSVDEALIDVTSQVQALADAPPELESSAKDPIADEDHQVGQDSCKAGDHIPKPPSPLPSTPDQPFVDAQIPDVSQRECETPPTKVSLDWAKVLAEKIRSDVRKATGCEVSIGIADNILLARLATRHAKPAGVFHLVQEAVPAFMADLEVGELPNFGYSTQQKIIDKFGTKKCGELLVKPKGVLQALLGNKTGESLYNFIRGIDKRKLEPHKERKSVSAEVNYGIRFISDGEAEQFLSNLSKEVSKRLKAIDRLGRLLTLKIMTRHPEAPLEAPKFMGHGVCDVVNKSAVLSNGKGGATDDPIHIADTILAIFRAGKFISTELRGVGIQVQKLESKSETLYAVEDGQHRLGFAVRAQPETLKVEPPVKEGPVIPPSTIISIPSGNEEDVIPIDSKDIVLAANRQFFNETVPRKTSEPARMSKFGKRRTTTTTVASAAILPPAPSEIDPEVWGFLPQEDQSAYRQAWVNQGLKIPRIFMEQSKATTSKVLDEPRVLFPNVPRTTKGFSNRGRSTSVQSDRKQRSESVVSRIKASPAREPGRSVIPGSEEVVDISGSSTSPAPDEYKDSDLLDLGLDLQVFHNLPREVQAESYRDAVVSRTTRQQLTKKAGHHNPVSPHTAGAHQSPRKQTPAIEVQEAPRRPKMNGTSDIENIMDMIREWMDRSSHEEPNQTEVKVVRKYLLRCVDPETAGIGGIQDAARVMGYWRRRWMRIWPKPAGSIGDDERPERAIEESWRRAFKEVRRDVDDLVQARFGGPLVLP